MNKKISDASFANSLRVHLKKYFSHLDGEHFNSNLYEDIVLEVEKVLISETMDYCNNVQSKAANMLGVNRNTLRNKIKQIEMQE
jgi:Fis family transcriptional regulator